jgi:pantoate--beta-alanine ligase
MPRLCHTREEVAREVALARRSGKQTGFVPTMGALHQGHLSLVSQAASENDFVVVSIFVNPIQFNNADDLRNYPRTIEHDMALLSTVPCDVVFYPSESEMYPAEIDEKYDFGSLSDVMEGRFRPGHFNGVAVVVKRLLDIVSPQRAYFGEKDFQQLTIIKNLVSLLHLPVEIRPCPTVREADGLAMSSRNTRLNPAERSQASFIYFSLQEAARLASEFLPAEVKARVVLLYNNNPAFRLEYFEIVNARTLQEVDTFHHPDGVVACVAAFMGQVRLIDNLMICRPDSLTENPS